MTTKIERYKDAGLPLSKDGRMIDHLYQKHLGGGTFSSNDRTWKRAGRAPSGRYIGQHTCCGSKRSYRHKSGCTTLERLASDDLSDLKDLKDL